MFKLFSMWLQAGSLIHPTDDRLPINPATPPVPPTFQLDKTRLNQLNPADAHSLGRSLLIRHLDVGSNNAEEAELVALSSPYYDISRFGIDFTASPRHADVLAITGPVTRHLKIAMERTIAAAPHPCIIVAIGDAACYGTPYETTYACLGKVDDFVPVDLYIPGNPPSPEEILAGLLHCKTLLHQASLN
jgi:Ni,Fe-hydrogenase III small subunit